MYVCIYIYIYIATSILRAASPAIGVLRVEVPDVLEHLRRGNMQIHMINNMYNDNNMFVMFIMIIIIIIISSSSSSSTTTTISLTWIRSSCLFFQQLWPACTAV